jgi:endonuclease VIII-like 1
MPEGPEIRIMSDFINHKTKNIQFDNSFHVERGNVPIPFSNEDSFESPFKIESHFYGKKLILRLYNEQKIIPIHIFMGMSGSWNLTDTIEWNKTKYVRMRFDSVCGKSLILHGGYLGPKYSLYENFKSSKCGPDMILEFDKFKDNIKKSLNKSVFKKPIYEVLLDQEYFNGVGNYLRSTILYYADVNPFEPAKEIIKESDSFLSLCRDILNESYNLNGGQLKDWKNPFDNESQKFDEWVFYKKGNSVKDSMGRTFWYNPKWKA